MSNRFSIQAIFSGKDEVSKVVDKIEGKVKTGFRGMANELGAATDGMMAGLANFAAKAAAVGAVLGTALAAGMMHVISTGATFEQAITNVGAVSGKSRNQIQDLEKAALSLGVSTQFSSTEVATAMEMMARKGFTTQEILQGIPGVLNAVAASGQDMATVAGIVGSSIRGFGLEASEAGRVANILAFVSSKTGATITDLGSALATAAPTAKALGVSIEDTTAAVGLLQRMGIDASTAGSATATMLAKITKPSKEAAAQMAKMGVKFKDAKGNMLPFNQVLGQFVKVGDKAGGNMDRMAFFAELVGLRGDKAALGLAEMQKSGDFGKLADDIQHVGDFAGDVAKIRMDTTLGSWKLLTSTIEVLETKLFNLKSGALREVIDKVNAWVAANQDLIVSGVQNFIQQLVADLPTIVLWLERIGKMVAVFVAFAAAVKVVTVAMAIFDAVSAANPWVLLAMAVVALIAVIYAFWPEISAFFSKLWTTIKTDATAIGAWFSKLWSGIVSSFMSVWNPVSAFFSSVFGGIKAIVVGVIDFMVGIWAIGFYAMLQVVKAVVNFFRPMWEPILVFFQILWEGVKFAFQLEWDVICAIAASVIATLQAIFAPIASFMAARWAEIKFTFIDVWNGIVAFATQMFDKLKAVWAPIGTFFSDLWDGIASTFESILGGIISRVERVISAIKSATGHIQDIGAGVIDGDFGAPAGDGSPMVSPSDRTADAAASNSSSASAQVVIRDETGRAQVTHQSTGRGSSVSMPASGSF